MRHGLPKPFKLNAPMSSEDVARIDDVTYPPLAVLFVKRGVGPIPDAFFVIIFT
jgi:hypothetical protein